MSIKILLVDDEVLLLESLAIILDLEPDFEVVGIAQNAYKALEQLKVKAVDVALVDLNMEGMNGQELILKLKEMKPHIKALVLTTFYDEKYIREAIRNGADGYLLKDSGKQVIIDGIKNLIKGQSTIDQRALAALVKVITPTKHDDIQEESLLELLTAREKEICTMIIEGYSNSQIASFLFITNGTVKNYMSSIYEKTGIKDRTTLALTLAKLLKKS